MRKDIKETCLVRPEVSRLDHLRASDLDRTTGTCLDHLRASDLDRTTGTFVSRRRSLGPDRTTATFTGRLRDSGPDRTTASFMDRRTALGRMTDSSQARPEVSRQDHPERTSKKSSGLLRRRPRRTPSKQPGKSRFSMWTKVCLKVGSLCRYQTVRRGLRSCAPTLPRKAVGSCKTLLSDWGGFCLPDDRRVFLRPRRLRCRSLRATNSS